MRLLSSSLSRRAALALGVAAAAGLAPQLAAAQQFPTKPVRIITPFPVGGGPDGVARLVAEKLGRAWNQPVVVENRPGGNGFIAIDAFKRGAKDGHDLIVLDNVHLAAYPSLFKKLPYDPVKDFDALLPLFKTYFFFTVAGDSKYKSVGDLIADAKAHPGKLNYGSWSVGNPVHLGSELFESATGTQMEHVIYKETTQLYTGEAPPGVPVGSLVARGDVELGFQQLSELLNVEGITVVGPLPPAIQITTIFSSGVGTASKQPVAAKALLDFLASSAATEAKQRQGMDPA